MFSGCATKPTPRSETDILRSNVFRVFLGKEEIFLSASITKTFSTTAVKAKMEFRMQATSVLL